MGLNVFLLIYLAPLFFKLMGLSDTWSGVPDYRQAVGGRVRLLALRFPPLICTVIEI